MVEQPNQQLIAEYGVNALHQSTQVNTDSLNRLAEVVDAGAIKPQIDQEFPLDRAAQAFTHLETGHPKGKVVIPHSLPFLYFLSCHTELVLVSMRQLQTSNAAYRPRNEFGVTGSLVV